MIEDRVRSPESGVRSPQSVLRLPSSVSRLSSSVFRSPSSFVHRLILVLWVCLALAGCTGNWTSIRPVVKIGLLAPFEGLYRQRGYEALAAMRAAIAETPVTGVSVLPLALDTSAAPEQARRSAQKLRQDPTVKAVVGPLFTETSRAAVEPLLVPEELLWLPDPLLADPEAARASRLQAVWFPELMQAITATEQSLIGLAVAGVEPGSALPILPSGAAPPLRIVDAPAEVLPEEAVVWLGMPAGGAAFLAALRAQGLDNPFWLAGDGYDVVFLRRALAGLTAADLPEDRFGPVYWAVWLDDGYEAWAAGHAPNTPAAYTVYRATQRAILSVGGASPPPAPHRSLYVFHLAPDGPF